MGQYHTLVAPSHGTWVADYPLGSGAKAIEKLGVPGVASALPLLWAAGLSDRPRNLPWFTRGDWAGHAAFMIGDYCDDEDLLGAPHALPFPESTLYSASSEALPLGSKPAKRKSLKDISRDIVSAVELACGVRALDLDENGNNNTSGWRDFLAVAKTENGWVENFSKDLSESDLKEVRDYFNRIGAQEGLWRRGPVRAAELGLPDDLPAPDAGEALLWVNLDRGEYFDLAPFGVFDLAAAMNHDTSVFVLTMLFHAERRGGGDLCDGGPLSANGRWRGDRIVLMGPGGFSKRGLGRWSQNEVREAFLDIGGLARVQSEILADASAQSKAPWADSGDLAAAEKNALRAALTSPAFLEIFDAEGPDAYQGLTLLCQPPLRARFAQPLAGATEHVLPPRFELSKGDGKICLPRDIWQRIHAELMSMDEEEIWVEANLEKRELQIEGCPARLVILGEMSNHSRLAALAG